MRQCVAPAPVSIRTSFFRSCFVCLSNLFLLLAVLFSNNSQAAEAPSTEETSALTWPLLPGENLNQLARLFYPDDSTMQAVFIRQTLTLSRDLHPQLQANQRFDQITSIVIPELKALSRHAGPPVRKPDSQQMARQMNEESIAIVTEAIREQYKVLEKEHEQLKTSLDALHNRLDHLQQTVQEFTLETRQALQTPATDKPASIQPAVIKPASSKTAVPQSPAETANIPDTQVVTSSSNTIAGILITWRHIALLACLLLLGLLLLWLLQRKRRKIAGNSKQFSQWLDTVQSGIAPQQSPPKPPSLPNEAEIEAEDLLQQARIMVGSGKPKSAIQLLGNAIDADGSQPLDTWFYLLDLCREQGMRDEFERHAQKLHRYYNVMTPKWVKMDIPLVVARSLEEFPHISQQLTEHWRNNRAMQYLTHLLTDNRDGERLGFGPTVAEEILLLQDVLEDRK